MNWPLVYIGKDAKTGDVRVVTSFNVGGDNSCRVQQTTAEAIAYGIDLIRYAEQAGAESVAQERATKIAARAIHILSGMLAGEQLRRVA